MKNYIVNLLGGLLLITSAIKASFREEHTILGIETPKYLYIFIFMILGVSLLISFFKERNQDKNL